MCRVIGCSLDTIFYTTHDSGVYNKLTDGGSGFQHFITPTFIKSNNQSARNENEKWHPGLKSAAVPRRNNGPTWMEQFSIVAEMRKSDGAEPGEGARLWN